MITPQPASPGSTLPDGIIRTIGVISFFDRFATPPILLVLTTQTALTLAQAVQLVAVYSLLYAVGQPIWGFLSDRFGRLPVLRIALVGALTGSVASTLFVTFTPLLLVRAVTGFMMGALYPALLTLIGDTKTGVERARSLSDLQIYSAIGTTLATLLAGSIALHLNWRLVFLLPALGCAVVLFALRRIAAAPRPQEFAFAPRRAFTRPALLVYLIAFLEGAAMVGALTYIVPALQDAGVGVTVAGLLASGYAVGIVLGAQLMRRLVRRYSRTLLMLAGGGVLLVALGVSALWSAPTAFAVTATLLGFAYAMIHSSMQGWATEVAPQARATTIAFFASALFLGSAASTFVTAGLAQRGEYGTIFGLALAVAVLLTVLATTAHAAWARRHPTGR